VSDCLAGDVAVPFTTVVQVVPSFEVAIVYLEA
jgi:hypothetical protein